MTQVPSLRQQYPLKNWRGCWDIFLSLALILGSIALCNFVSFFFYPFAVLIIANRLFAISLIGHEALHGNLFRSRFWNQIGGQFCCFLVMISFKKYRRLHLLHHQTLGSELYDPDLHLYRNYPETRTHFFKRVMISVITGKMAYAFLQYYTELPELLTKKKNRQGRMFALTSESDLIALFIFWSILIGVSLSLGLGKETILFGFVPALGIMQPYVIYVGGLQHGPFKPTQESHLMSRSVLAPSAWMWFLLPLDINFHGEHHLSPQVPHYWLKSYSQNLIQNNRSLWRESYQVASRSLFLTNRESTSE